MFKNILKNFLVFYISACFAMPSCAYTLLKDDIPSQWIESVGSKKIVYHPAYIMDENFAGTNLKNIKPVYHFKYFEDTPIILTENNKYFKKPVFKGIIDLEPGIAVQISPAQRYMSLSLWKELEVDGKKVFLRTPSPMVGEEAVFHVVNDVYENGKLIIKKGTEVQSIIGFSQPAESGGIEGAISAERFRTLDINGKIVRLNGSIYSEGTTTSGIYYFIGMAAAPFTFGVSTILMYAGGSAGRLSPKKVYTVYYKPDTL